MISNNYQFQILTEQKTENDDRFDESEKLGDESDREDPVPPPNCFFIEVRVLFFIVVRFLHRH